MTTTTTSWTTTADVPPGPWATMVADMRALLGVSSAAGATVTDPTSGGPPTLNDDCIDFTVQAPAAGSAPLTVTFTRAAGTGQVVTNAPTTSGLVVAAVSRAAQHWGLLLTWTTDADTRSQAVADGLVEALFGAGDRAVIGVQALTVEDQVAQIGTRAKDQALAKARAAGTTLTVDAGLAATIAELVAIRTGLATATAMTTPPPPPPPPAAPAP